MTRFACLVGSLVALNGLGCSFCITPKMPVLLCEAFYSMFSMCAEDSSFAPVRAHAAPVHCETADVLPFDRQHHCTFGLTYHRAGRVDYTIIPHLDLCSVSETPLLIAILHAKINATAKHLAAPRPQRAAML